MKVFVLLLIVIVISFGPITSSVHAFKPAGHSLMSAVPGGELEATAAGNRAGQLLDVVTLKEAATPTSVELSSSL